MLDRYSKFIGDSMQILYLRRAGVAHDSTWQKFGISHKHEDIFIFEKFTNFSRES